MQVLNVTSPSIKFMNVVGYHAYVLIYVKFRERIIFEELLETRAGEVNLPRIMSFPLGFLYVEKKKILNTQCFHA